MALRIQQHARAAGENWWDWAVWLEGPPGELDHIKSVTYVLHPTFVEPIQVVKSRADNFRLESRGWGEFEIKARVEYKDGRKPSLLKHELTLAEEAPRRGRAPKRAPQPKKLRIFISSSVTDAPTASLIRQSLEGRFRFVSNEEVPLGSSVSENLEENIRKSDAVVAIVSDSKSSWVERELNLANELKIPVLPVLVGDAVLPGFLKQTPTLRIDSPEQVGKTADRIAQSLEAKLK